jgi:glycosyltransferase involved in cell wall biosynthesis
VPAALIVSHDVVGPLMAGPGIRYWEIASALARRGLEVALAAPEGSDPGGAPFATLTYRPGDAGLPRAAAGAGAVMVTGPLLEQFPELKASAVPLVVDLYDPFLFENLHRLRGAPERWPHHAGGRHALAEQARRGDWFVCANERQRDLYLGMLAAWGRVNPATYDADPTLRSLLEVVPFGLPAEPPRPGPGLRRVLPGIGPDDRLVVWNGGPWDWFDPPTALRAIARLARDRPEVRLVFMGTRHPNPAVGEPPMAARTRALADELGLSERVVFFREWTPYRERGAGLLEADAAVSLHLPGVETRYASRTRLLDWVWAGLPGVVTEGDAIGDDLARRGLAVAVPPGDEAAVAEGLARLLDEGDARARRRVGFAALAEELSWERCVEPLARFLGAPRPAADRSAAAAGARPGTADGPSAERSGDGPQSRSPRPAAGAPSGRPSGGRSLRDRFRAALRMAGAPRP